MFFYVPSTESNITGIHNSQAAAMWAAAGNSPSCAEVLDRAEAYLSLQSGKGRPLWPPGVTASPIFGELFSFRMGFQEMGSLMTDMICLKDH